MQVRTGEVDGSYVVMSSGCEKTTSSIGFTVSCTLVDGSYVVMSSGCEKTTSSIGFTVSFTLRWARRTHLAHGHSELGSQQFL